MEGSAYVEATIRAVRAAARDPAAHGHLPAGVPQADRRRHRAAAAAGPGDPPGQGRLRRAGDDRVPRQAPGRRQLPRAGRRFLLDGRGRPIRLGLGTHDVELIEQIAAQAAAAGIGRDAFEIEMLYGIRTGEQYRLAQDGLPRRDAHRLR